METDFTYYLVATIAVIVTGISKGGFGGIALLAVPLLSLVMPATQAAAIMLPLLLAMDALGIWAYRNSANWGHLKMLLPGAVMGIGVGTLTATFVTETIIQLIVGIIAVVFVLYTWFPKKSAVEVNENPSKFGVFWGSLAGYTSFIAHAGSPPFHVYLLPKRLPPKELAGTAIWFFAIVNLIKLPAYLLSSQITIATLQSSALLLPLVPIGFYLGLWLNKTLPEKIFYRVIYISALLIGIKLIISSLS